MIFDTHAHYDDEKFQEDRDSLLSSIQEKGIGTIVNVACDLNSCETSLALAEKYPFVYAALGVHPSDIDCLSEEGFARMESELSREKVVAVGEIGLDYYWEKDPEVRNRQKYWFVRQMELAEKHHLPVIIHSREAAADTMDIIKARPRRENPGVVHCYSYSVEHAREYIKMGWMIGVGGVVTYSNAKVLKEVVKEIPLERIVLETDCPYLSPTPNRGKRNDSSNLVYVVDKIAELKEISAEEVVRQTELNARKLYQM